ncbi:hypothetical protein BAUCODRAFT_117187 [Baudoinia panamericana UAMH 10762]|uniref:Uncharacterized protein n=1 Tax=Baudoinia panamericana (strain UAMH 10762) TaxID=717646 RepID=M2N089_BAUPA|nr:uncharacterized protein BAUCODRAFT_117187 [Baudoinia panamericana UAMH 10762]EMC91985.1 hypothetical protein BAUCODRAFT_117187 [Baudoinia panamericana UAMH 10762]
MSDPRFAALANDPRYRLPNRKETRTAVDPRFSRLFTDQDFRRKAKVDRYGRKVTAESGRKELEKQYRLDEVKKEREVVGSDDESESGSEADEKVVVERRDPAREGGFSGSESEEESTDDEDEQADEVEAELAEETAGQEQTEDIPLGEVSSRIAVVNLDWDNLRAADIMAVAASFVPSSGRIEKVAVYPSEFGRERMQREEIEGPPKEIFSATKRLEDGDDSNDDDEEEDDKIKDKLLRTQTANENDSADFNPTALRTYQLQRLRYFYAVITCSDPSTAHALYSAMDGREYLSSANFFDLRFIPDSTSFDDDVPRDECTEVVGGYRPSEFRTEALTHSKVRLTWDEEGERERKEVQRRAFGRGEQAEEDLRAYVASEGDSDAESVVSRKSAAEDRKEKKKAEQRRVMRAKLGLGEVGVEKGGKGGEGEGDAMQITFTSGLTGTGKNGGVFENEPLDAESTKERYIRKERERKQKRKEKMKASRNPDATSNTAIPAETGAEADVVEEDAGFNDPFFADPAASSTALAKAARKAERKKAAATRAAEEAEAAERRKELELLMSEDKADEVRHFDMREVEKREKEARRKGKKAKSKKQKEGVDVSVGEGEGDGGFQVDSADPRFKRLFEDHEFAIDPTNPRFKGTEGMRGLLEEGRRKRARGDEAADGDAEVEGSKRVRKGEGTRGGGDEVKGLVARLKKSQKAR